MVAALLVCASTAVPNSAGTTATVATMSQRETFLLMELVELELDLDLDLKHV